MKDRNYNPQCRNARQVQVNVALPHTQIHSHSDPSVHQTYATETPFQTAAVLPEHYHVTSSIHFSSAKHNRGNLI